MDMDPKHLFYLSEIIRYGSLSRASERLGVVQPTLTRIIKILEDQAGAPLLNRGRYGVSPTEIGERLALSGTSIGTHISAAREAAEQWKSGIGQELRLGVGPMLAHSIMPPFLERYLSQNWPYALKITTASAGQLVEWLNDDEIDVVLAPSQLALHQEKLRQETVLEDRMAIYAGIRSPLLSVSGPIGADVLAQQTWASVGARSHIYESQGELFRGMNLHGVVPKVTFGGDAAMCLSLLRTTDLLVTLPEKLTDVWGGLERRQKLKTDVPMATRDVAVWTTKANHDRPQVIHFKKQFLGFLDRLSKTAESDTYGFV